MEKPGTSSETQQNLHTSCVLRSSSARLAMSSSQQKLTSSNTPQTNPNSLNKSANFLRFFFRGTLTDRRRQIYISNEGSITKIAWNGINKNTNSKVRLETLQNLDEVAKKRRLQVGTLEGIWAETNDMLENDAERDTYFNFMSSLTKSQNEELGLALRHTFFEVISLILKYKILDNKEKQASRCYFAMVGSFNG